MLTSKNKLNYNATNKTGEKMKIYVDLDGVISDFQGLIEEHMGMPIKDAPKGKMWSSIYHYNKYVNPFFESLPLMSDAMILWNFVTENFDHVEILSACGNTPKDAKEQKIRWVEKTLTGYAGINIVVKSSDKAQFADDESILIDDRDKSIGPWIEAGGIGILHTSAEETIKELEQYIEKAS